MEYPHDRWFPAIRRRRSRHQFEAGRAVPPEIWQRLQNLARAFRPFPGVRLELGNRAVETIFKGALGTYGKVKDAPAFMAVIADTHNPHYQEAAGYTGEGLILEAVSMGLSTCWVGGFFNPEAAARLFPLENGERVLAVSPLGYPAQNRTLEEKVLGSFTRSDKRLPASRLISGPAAHVQPVWLKEAVEAVRLAPSAMNRQPWRLLIEKDSVLFTTNSGRLDFNISKRLDCGIAMLHFDIAARFHGLSGQWNFLEAPQVARFAYPPASPG